ncbi:hypothetical protein [Sphingomonas soli]|uniref:hypothetical protein n=1 Tax=Sphingomonas soli TaxID=266127 RepID=UPI0008371CDA|nr:hypothetical protein [Sphingomonas soli]
MMKLAIAAAAILAATPALADDWDFVLINGSGKTIKTIEIAATGTTTWQANKVDPEFKKEDSTVKNGARTTVHFDKGPGCKYDVKLNFTDDSSATLTGVNVCDNSFVTAKLNAAGVASFTSN